MHRVSRIRKKNPNKAFSQYLINLQLGILDVQFEVVHCADC